MRLQALYMMQLRLLAIFNMYYVSINDHGIIQQVYGSISIDPDVDKQQITDEDFAFISEGSKPFRAFMYIKGRAVVNKEYEFQQSILLIENAIQSLHDKSAKDNGYDNINSCAKYLGYDNPFRAECEALCLWAALSWQECYRLLALYKAGQMDAIDANTVLDLMPNLVL